MVWSALCEVHKLYSVKTYTVVCLGIVQEIFIVKKFRSQWQLQKLILRKITRTINVNMVRGRSYENFNTKVSHKNFQIYGLPNYGTVSHINKEFTISFVYISPRGALLGIKHSHHQQLFCQTTTS